MGLRILACTYAIQIVFLRPTPWTSSRAKREPLLYTVFAYNYGINFTQLCHAPIQVYLNTWLLRLRVLPFAVKIIKIVKKKKKYDSCYFSIYFTNPFIRNCRQRVLRTNEFHQKICFVHQSLFFFAVITCLKNSKRVIGKTSRNVHDGVIDFVRSDFRF